LVLAVLPRAWSRVPFSAAERDYASHVSADASATPWSPSTIHQGGQSGGEQDTLNLNAMANTSQTI